MEGPLEHRSFDDLSLVVLSVRVGGCWRVWSLWQGPTGSHEGLGTRQVHKICRARVIVRACVWWGRCGCRSTQNPTHGYSSTSHTHGHTRDTHTHGGGGARSPWSPPKRAARARPGPPPADPSPRCSGGRGGSSRQEGEGKARLRDSGRPRNWGRGGRWRRSPAPLPNLSASAPWRPVSRGERGGAVKGRVGSTSNLPDLGEVGRPPRWKRDRSGEHLRAGAALP